MTYAAAQAVLQPGFASNAVSALSIPSSSWLDERMAPAYVSALSLLVGLLSRMLPGKDEDVLPSCGSTETFTSRRGGLAAVSAKCLRLASILALFGLTLTPTPGQSAWDRSPLAVSLTYASLLGLLNVVSSSRRSLVYSLHLSLVMFAVFAVYAYRDLWPLMTFTLHPRDEDRGTLLWVEIGLATFAGIIEPLFEPYPYVPVDAKNPMAHPNPEQTASIASFLFYVFLDPMVWRAYRVPHLPHDQLPPLCDYDAVKYLINQEYQTLDPQSGAKNRSLLFGFVKIFRVEITYQVVLLVTEAFFKLAAPIGVNRLLNYLEHKGDLSSQSALVRPWVWIIWIAMGPMVDTILLQLYEFISGGVLVRTEALLTALLFDHSLRIRLKAETDPSADKAADEDPKDSTKSNLVGRINNLVTSDLDSIGEGREFLSLAISVPVQLVLATWFLYVVLGWSVFVGMAVMVATFPVPAKFAALMEKLQKSKMSVTDARVQAITETIGVLRMIKLFGWEKRVQNDIDQKRKYEMDLATRGRIIDTANFFVNHTVPLVHMVVTYSTFTLVMKQDLTASIVFSSMTAFNMIRRQLVTVSQSISTLISAKVSLGRVADFLWKTELLDVYDETRRPSAGRAARSVQDLGFGHVDFAWTQDDGTDAQAQPGFRLRVEDDVVFTRGVVHLITGATGSGKTSVLMALLGEMHLVVLGKTSWVNLPREGGVAYASQESWVLNATIKENILLGHPFDEARYQKVLYQCALNPDLRLLEAGDATDVGERGLTLSGGQKARITLARAVYSPAEILLLDDTLASLDVHTVRWVVEKCLKGDLVKGRTVLLVTHNLAATRSLAKFAVSLGQGGVVTSSPTLITEDSTTTEVAHELDALELDEHEDEALKAAPSPKEGQLIVAEEIAIGRVSWQAVKMLLVTLGGDWPVLIWSQTLIGLTLSEFFDVIEMWWLGQWALAYALQTHDAVRVPYYLGVYGLIIFSVIFWSIWGHLFYFTGRKFSSRTLSARLMSAVTGATFRWLDTTPVSRIITRCTKDMQAVDGPVQGYLRVFFIVTINMLIKLSAVIFYTPVFIVPAILTALLGATIGQVYIKAQMSVKRELSNAKSPVLSVFGGAMSGLISIRAYGAQRYFRSQLLEHIDHYTRANRAFNNLQRWIAVRIDMLSAIFSTAVAFYLIYSGYSANPSSIGFILTVAVTFTEMVLWCVHMYNGFEVNSNSLERVHQYLSIEQEPKDGDVPPAYWPSSGTLRVEKLSARYSADGPMILQDLSFEIMSGERVGIVGRTGAGKSTLTLALLRCIPTEGLVKFDGISTSTITLEALRSNITIIPQMPELMSGTLRRNLDPFGQHDDATLNHALRSAGWFSIQTSSDEGSMALDAEIAGGGSNLSVGQRQIIALARAMVRQSKLLVLDEATSAIDYAIDSVIQDSLRTELKKDVTVLTIAHRLQTIMDYDKIMVLDAGRLVEFDSPKALLSKKDGLLHSLVEASADKEALYRMADV